MKSNPTAAELDAARHATAFQQALGHLQRGELDVAEALLRPLLHLMPDEPNVWQLTGVVRAQQGDMAEAATLLTRAVELNPANAGALHNLGNVLALLQRREEAVQRLSQSLELQPANVAALVTRAQMLGQLHRPYDALQSLDAALALKPDAREALIARADVLRKLHEVGMVPREDVVAGYRIALDAGADPENVRYCLAALGEEAAPKASPAQFVTDLFDSYAEQFDEHLLGELQYRTPVHIGQLLQQLGQAGDATVLDLGCGTGLCGPLLRPLARSLVGVDLSPRMLDKARERGLYDELACADVLQHLQGTPPASLDLVVAADVFVYIGDLSEVFAATAQALRPRGRFVFSIEQPPANASDAAAAAEAGMAGYTLLSTRRYAHAQAYVETLAAAHGLVVEQASQEVLRLNAGNEVMGQLLALRRA